MRSGNLSLVFSQTGMFRWVFSVQYIINFAGRISEAVMGGAEGAQRPILLVQKPKKMGARSARARQCDQNPLVNK
jgi:hypothetical protein